MMANTGFESLADRATELRETLETEEATKHALVMPFIQELGYNVFDPREVVPEFTADVGIKSGEKVDYAIMHDGDPSILFECKHVEDTLDTSSISQLYRYFTSTKARIGVLTNGIVYKFFSDLDETNKMDDRPFLEIDLLILDDKSLEELKRFEKQSFDVDSTLEAAAVLKYIRGMKQALVKQMTEPDEEFVRWLARNVYSRTFTKPVRERFERLATRAFREFINDRIDLTLKTAIARESGESDDSDDSEDDSVEEIDDRGIVTTAQELEGYMIVKAILREGLDVSRVTLRDTKSYCGILLDDTNRKPICRLRFNNPERLVLTTLDEDKQEIHHPIESLNEIYDHADTIRHRAQLYTEDEH